MQSMGLPLLYWRRNLGKSGQDSTLGNVLNTIRLCKPGFTKAHTTLGNMEVYGNRIAYDFVSPGLQNLIRLWIV